MKQQTFDTAAQVEVTTHWHTLGRLLHYLWMPGQVNLKLRVLAALVCLIAAKVLTIYVPFFYKYAVDALSAKNAVLVLPVAMIIAYGGARALSQAFGELRDAIFAKVGQHAIRHIALRTFRHLHNLSLAFHLERQTGGLSRVIERGTQAIQFVLAFMLFNILPTLLEIVLVCGILLYKFNVWFSLVTFISVTSYIFFTIYVTEWRIKYRKRMNQMDTEANTKAIDSLLNFETVKYFANETHEAQRYDCFLEKYQQAAVKNQTSLSLLNIGQGILIAAGLTIIMLMAAHGIVKGKMSIGDFVLVNTLLMQLYQPLNFLGFVYRQIKQSLIDMDKMFELLKVNAAVKDKPDAKELTVSKGEISFDNVSFSYFSERLILKNINFTLPPGKTIAIIGPSGAGKSTISRLVFRFYDVDAGAIKIDGQDIRDVTQHSLRTAIGIVPQDTVLFNDTIAYNINYGCPTASMAELKQAAKFAQVDNFVTQLPHGYDTLVGERGLKLSGGEKQRVAIARTLLKNPKILLFDEATSALDTHTEKDIQTALNKVSVGRSTIIIAHRLSTVVDADEILVLKQGEIIERGRHADLLAMQGEYAKMWSKQQQVIEYEQKLSVAKESTV